MVADVMDGASAALVDLIRQATHPDVSRRLDSVDKFLAMLAKVEDAAAGQADEQAIDPAQAKAGDRLDGGFTVIRRLGRGRIAWAEPAAGAGKSRWLGSSRALHFDLCRAIQRCLAEGQVPCTLSKRGAARLTALVEEFSFLDGRAQAIIADEGSIHWWTFAGGRANAALALALANHQCRVRRSDDFGIDLDDPPPSLAAADLINALDNADGADIDHEISGLKFSACLPLPLARDLVLRRRFDLDGAIQVVASDT